MALYGGEVRESRRRLEPVPATAQMQLTEPQQDELERCARSRSVAARAVQRAKIILGLTAGKTKKEIAQQLGIVRQTVRRWEQRFLQHGARGWMTRRAPAGRPSSSQRRSHRSSTRPPRKLLPTPRIGARGAWPKR